MSDNNEAVKAQARAMIAKRGRLNAAILADEAAVRARLAGLTKTAEEMELIAAEIRAT